MNMTRHLNARNNTIARLKTERAAQALLVADAARILRAFVTDDLDAMPWDDARD